MYPTESKTGISDFVLVRDIQEGSPWPIYDNVIVKMAEGQFADYTLRPVTITGRFSTTEQQSVDVFNSQLDAVFAIDTATLEP